MDIKDYEAKGLPVPTAVLAEKIIEGIQDPGLKRMVLATIQTHSPDIVQCVKVFHTMYDMPILRPYEAREDFSHIPKNRLAMRARLIAEEFKEWCASMDIRARISYDFQDEEGDWHEAESFEQAIEETEERNMGAVADACVDMMYVITGFMLEVGIDPHAVLREIQASNMTKLGQDGKPVRRADGKILKGPHYVRANARAALSAHGMRFGPKPPVLTTDLLVID